MLSFYNSTIIHVFTNEGFQHILQNLNTFSDYLTSALLPLQIGGDGSTKRHL
jgi:hypothetical protein